jgi:hypothetical protein
LGYVGGRLYTGAVVHYRDETDISGFVAPDGPLIIFLTALGSVGSAAGESSESR